eukprot:g3929.t1
MMRVEYSTTGPSTTNLQQAITVQPIIIVNFKLRLNINPDLRWSYRLITLLKRHVSLITASAFISTMGGGYFLCKKIDSAMLMAQKQSQIAILLQNRDLFLQCQLHLAYSSTQCGKFAQAEQIFHFVQSIGIQDGNDQLVRMCAHGLYNNNISRSITEYVSNEDNNGDTEDEKSIRKKKKSESNNGSQRRITETESGNDDKESSGNDDKESRKSGTAVGTRVNNEWTKNWEGITSSSKALYDNFYRHRVIK